MVIFTTHDHYRFLELPNVLICICLYRRRYFIVFSRSAEKTDFTYANSLSYRSVVTPDRVICMPNMTRRMLERSNGEGYSSPELKSNSLLNRYGAASVPPPKGSSPDPFRECLRRSSPSCSFEHCRCRGLSYLRDRLRFGRTRCCSARIGVQAETSSF